MTRMELCLSCRSNVLDKICTWKWPIIMNGTYRVQTYKRSGRITKLNH